ncbi:glucose-1-phosphate adenylyltransferase [Corallincola luteus]|uniref:Glucose-1-phosphate adenylyltransferase n=4 Tax=Psychromonadaceae TaxID=267894 RepID=A0A368NLL6_9GAMM|nr:MULTISPECIES: glucose-1-phosphate adenylyltransferase [Corallincola]RCU51492.1 glucose-1-phosphate adenylyltransferase [Corallincola holothuriorum]TAA47627.1 glucose-1-phosphate adenylyltransferase [Corallincola spongiicola]TCI05606.1 glucose-1-phosphate adenylyltransferase [Corallincola luteus]
MPSSRIPGNYVNELTRSTLAMILAGGRGERLMHLTRARAKPATPFGGKYRIIDFTLSNCVNSGIRRIGVLTQYKASELIIHLQRAWGHFRGEFGEFVNIIPAQQQIGTSWYRGTADAIYQNLSFLRDQRPERVLILGGDHVYKMDYTLLLSQHVETGADITIGCIPVPKERGAEFGVMSIDDNHRITEFVEKPEQPTPMPGREDMTLASMGIYVIEMAFLEKMLMADGSNPHSSHDFGMDIIPKCVAHHNTYAYCYEDDSASVQPYWKDVGNIDEYYQASMDLVNIDPELNLYDERWPIWTYQEQLPAAKFVFEDEKYCGMALNSMVSAGCIISGGVVKRSLLSYKVTVEQGSSVEDAVLMPSVQVGRHCRIRRAVIAERCEIPDGMVIGEDLVLDAKRFYVSRNGVVVVVPEMIDAWQREQAKTDS